MSTLYGVSYILTTRSARAVGIVLMVDHFGDKSRDWRDVIRPVTVDFPYMTMLRSGHRTSDTLVHGKTRG